MADLEDPGRETEELSTAPVAYTPSAAFKSNNQLTKPAAIPLLHHFSTESRTFEGSPLKKTALNRTDFIPLGTGRPSSELYPWSLNSKIDTSASNGYSFATALNYGHAGGSLYLVRYLTEHIEAVHDPPYRNWETCLTAGSTSAMEIALRIFTDRGNSVLMERFTYPGFLEAANLSGLTVEGIEMDADGLRADALAAKLDKWDDSSGPKPKLLYTIPTGQNPTGHTQPLARRKAIYEVAERHDLIIIEDDPYYYLDMGPSPGPDEEGCPQEDLGNKDHRNFISRLVPSYLALDRSGRVIRLDSTAKILAPGLRAGWVTANERFISKFMSYHEVTTVAVSGMSQLMLYNLLDKEWGHDGFYRWLQDLSHRYRRRRDMMINACIKHMPEEICNFIPPSYGMFVWVRLDLTKHPHFKGLLGSADDDQLRMVMSRVEQTMIDDALVRGVQVTKGSLFLSGPAKMDEMYVRMTFAAAQEDALEEGVRKFSGVIAREFEVPVVATVSQ